MPKTSVKISAAKSAAVRLSKSEIRKRAVAFSNRWEGTTSEKSESQTFWNEFFEVFGIRRRTVGLFEKSAQKTSTGNVGWVDLLFPGEMAVEHKSADGDLDAALEQLIDYVPSLTDGEKPWLLVECDFATFRWHNLDTGETDEFTLSELEDNLGLFYWMARYPKPGEQYANEEDANLAATDLMARIHDRMADAGYGGHELREWLTRVLFCMFADDTGVWDPAAFQAYVAAHTREDGSDLGPQIAHLFQVLNQADEDRPAGLDEELAQFTYINGDLFEENLTIPSCDGEVRDALLAACRFDWSAISPAIFGSMFQNVMVPAERRQLGAHYTSEANILKTIRPLFLDALEAELAAAKTKPALQALLDKIASLTVMDPAAGCGNFLVVAYRELRRLETEALRRLYAKQGKTGQLSIDVTLQCKVTVDQFHGIELEEFPAKIARTAMYLVDHLANREVSTEFGQHYARFPIPAAPHIVQGDALEIDWDDVLPADDADYVFGNPPFAGHTTRSKAQSDQMRALWGDGYAKWLDYVTCWFRKALDYGQDQQVRFAFVATNSTSQGEQVARLWLPLLDAGYTIDFAHQNFAWRNEAKGNAAVSVVIVGFSHGDRERKPRLFEYSDRKGDPVGRPVRRINPYLVEGPNIVAARRREPLSPLLPQVKYGSLASDGGHLVVKPAERPQGDPVAEKYLRPYYGTNELVKGLERYCLWMPDGPDPGDLKKSKFVAERLAKVREWRKTSKNADTRDLATQPYRFFHVARPDTPYIGIPAQVSETRPWYTVAHLNPHVIASNTLYFAEDPDGFLFAVLSSSAFVTWLRAVGGTLENRLRFSGGVVYNTFPLPETVPDAKRDAAIEAGKKVLAARPDGVSLADMYAPDGISPALLKAHRELDKAVDAIVAPRRKLGDNNARLSALMDRYKAMIEDDV